MDTPKHYTKPNAKRINIEAIQEKSAKRPTSKKHWIWKNYEHDIWRTTKEVLGQRKEETKQSIDTIKIAKK